MFVIADVIKIIASMLEDQIAFSIYIKIEEKTNFGHNIISYIKDTWNRTPCLLM